MNEIQQYFSSTSHNTQYFIGKNEFLLTQYGSKQNESRLRDLRPGKTQTGLLRYRH